MAFNFFGAGAIKNADVSDGTLTPQKVDIDGGTDISADLDDADLFIVDDGAGGTNRKSALSRVKKYIYSAITGDATASDSGSLTIGSGAVEHAMLADNIISGQAELAAKTDLAGADDLMIHDATDNVVKKAGLDTIQAFLYDAISGDIGVSDSGTAAIQGGAVEFAMMDAAAVTLSSEFTSNLTADDQLPTTKAVKDYVDSVVQGLEIKDSVIAKSVSNIAGTYNAGNGTITAASTGALAQAVTDERIMADGERLLVAAQTDEKQNGIYVVTEAGDGSTAYVLTRAADFDSDDDVSTGAFVFIEEGDSFADQGFVMSNHEFTSLNNATGNQGKIQFTQFSGAGQITAGLNLSKTGNTINLDTTIANDALILQRVDGHDQIKFDTDNKLVFHAANAKRMEIAAAGLDVIGNIVGSSLIQANGTLSLDAGTNTISAAELNVLDGVTGGTVTAQKALVVDANKDLTELRRAKAKSFYEGVQIIDSNVASTALNPDSGSVIVVKFGASSNVQQNHTINLPAAASELAGIQLKIKRIDTEAQAFNLVISPNGSDRIDHVNGAVTLLGDTDHAGVSVLCTGSEWFLL